MVRLSIQRVILYPEGTSVVITAASKENASGAWRLTAAQTLRLAGTAGLTPVQLGLTKGTLVVTGKFVKAGEAWSEVVRKTGEVRSGTFTKDHYRVEELAVEIAPADKLAVMAAGILAAQFSSMAAVPAPADNRAVAELPDEEDTFIPEPAAAPVLETATAAVKAAINDLS